MSPLLTLKRDVNLALRQGSDTLVVFAFFVIAVSLFPFGIGPEPNVLARIASGVLWVTALLAVLLSLDRIFAQDFEDGSLDLLATAPGSFAITVLAKATAHWITTGLPLTVLAPLLGALVNLDPDGVLPLMAALALGTPILSLVGAVGAALVLGARRGGVLLSLLVLPLYIPVLIFGVGAVEGAVMGFSPAGPLSILAGLLFIALPLCPWAAAAAARQALE